MRCFRCFKCWVKKWSCFFAYQNSLPEFFPCQLCRYHLQALHVAWGIEAQGLLGSPHGSLGPWTSMQPCSHAPQLDPHQLDPQLDPLSLRALTFFMTQNTSRHVGWTHEKILQSGWKTFSLCVRNNRDTISYIIIHYHTLSYHLWCVVSVSHFCMAFLFSSFRAWRPAMGTIYGTSASRLEIATQVVGAKILSQFSCGFKKT